MNNYKPIPYYMIPSFQRGGLLAPNNMYPNLANANGLNNLLIRPQATGYEQGVQLQQGIANLRQQNRADQQFAAQQEQQQLINKYREEQVKIQNKALELEQINNQIQFADKYLTPILNMDINPGDLDRYNEILTQNKLLDKDGNIDIDLSSPNGYLDTFKKINKLKADGEMRGFAENAATGKALNAKLDVIAERMGEIASDPTKKLLFEDLSEDYRQLKQKVLDAKTSPGFNWNDLDSQITGFDYKLSETGQKQFDLASRKTELDIKSQELAIEAQEAFAKAREIEDPKEREAQMRMLQGKYGKSTSASMTEAERKAQREEQLISDLRSRPGNENMTRIDAINLISKADKGELYDNTGEQGVSKTRGIRYATDGTVDYNSSVFVLPGGTNPVTDLSKASLNNLVKQNGLEKVKDETKFYNPWSTPNEGQETFVDVNPDGVLYTNNHEVYELFTGQNYQGDWDDHPALVPHNNGNAYRIDLTTHPALNSFNNTTDQGGGVVVNGKHYDEHTLNTNPAAFDIKFAQVAKKDYNDISVNQLNYKSIDEHTDPDYRNNFYSNLDIGFNGQGVPGEPEYVPPLAPDMRYLALALNDTQKNVKFTSFSRSQEEQAMLVKKVGPRQADPDSYHLKGKAFDTNYDDDLWRHLKSMSSAINGNELTIKLPNGASVLAIKHEGTGEHIHYKLISGSAPSSGNNLAGAKLKGQ